MQYQGRGDKSFRDRENESERIPSASTSKPLKEVSRTSGLSNDKGTQKVYETIDKAIGDKEIFGYPSRRPSDIHDQGEEKVESRIRTKEEIIDDIGKEKYKKLLPSAYSRQRLIKLIQNGNIETALVELEKDFPGFLDSRPNIAFSLNCQKFLEMIKRGDTIFTAIEFGRSLLKYFSSPYNLNQSFKTTLENAFSLVAYVDPNSCPMSHLLKLEQRNLVSDMLNNSILDYEKNQDNTIELLLQHFEVLKAQMEKNDLAASLAMLDVDVYGTALQSDDMDVESEGGEGKKEECSDIFDSSDLDFS